MIIGSDATHACASEQCDGHVVGAFTLTAADQIAVAGVPKPRADLRLRVTVDELRREPVAGCVHGFAHSITDDAIAARRLPPFVRMYKGTNGDKATPCNFSGSRHTIGRITCSIAIIPRPRIKVRLSSCGL